MAEDRMVFGAILGFVGGFVILIFGAIETYVAATLPSVSSISGLAGTVETILLFAGIAGIVFGLLIMILSALLSSYPEYNVSLGVLLIVLALLSFFIMGGGDGIGFLLVVVAGACGIAFGEAGQPFPDLYFPERVPRPWESPESSPEVAGERPAPPPAPLGPPVGPLKGCPECGKSCPADSPTCPNCGRAFS